MAPSLSTRYVPDWGSKAARLVLIGEAPGKTENERGQPFVGASYYTLRDWWRPVGLDRNDFYIMNFFGYYPGGGDAALDALFKKNPASIQDWSRSLHERIAALTDPFIIIPTGNKAMHALTGITRFFVNEKGKPGITSVRGYFFQYTDLNGRKIKLIPTIHPAATFRNKAFERQCIYDWQRIAREKDTRELSIPHRETLHSPTESDILTFREEVRAKYKLLNVDIETPKQEGEEITPAWEEVIGEYKAGKKKGQPKIKIHKEKRKKIKGAREIAMVGFSHSRDFAITIPLNTSTFKYWTPEQNVRAREVIAELLSMHHVEKIFQNGMFDNFWLAGDGYKVNNWQWDCLAMHHALYPDEPHDLNYQCSLDPIRAQYWKSAGKEDDESDFLSLDGAEAYRHYNGLDNCLQFEVYEVRRAELESRGLLEFYFQHYRNLFEPLLALMRHGVRIDTSKRAEWHKRLREEVSQIHQRLALVAGEELHAKKDISNKKLQHYLYETLKLPKHYKKRGTGEKTLTADEVTVRKLYLRFPAVLGESYELMLQAKRKQKLSTFLTDKPIDKDGKLRCEYKFSTKSGRLASKQNPKGTGTNLQNIDREIRSTFLPDEGMVMLDCDYSQAESRIRNTMAHACTKDSNDEALRRNGEELYAIARSHPTEFDEHSYVGYQIFNVHPSEISGELRDIAKRTNHAYGYGEHGNKMSEILLNEDIVRSPEECERWITTLLKKNPAIPTWQATIRKIIMSQLKLTNSWGFEISFKHMRLNDEVYRFGYSWIPQGEVGRLLNQYALVPLYQWIKENHLEDRINLQVHDSLVVSCLPQHVWHVANFLNWSMPRERVYWGLPLSIPCGFKVGRNWKDGHEWKKLPSEKEMTEYAYSCLETK